MTLATYNKSYNVEFLHGSSIFSLHCDSSFIQELIIHCLISKETIFWLSVCNQVTNCLYESFERLPKLCQIFINILGVLDCVFVYFHFLLCEFLLHAF